MAQPPMNEDRFEALLAERFAPAARRGMAPELSPTTPARKPAGEQPFPLEFVRRHIRFEGQIPPKVRQALSEWLPDMLAFAQAQGLTLRDLNHQIQVYDRPSYERVTRAPVPAGVPLPASSYQYNPLYRVYTIRLVLSDAPDKPEEVVAVLRVLLSRLLGDVYLREEVLNREPYHEDMAKSPQAVSAGLGEKIALLAAHPSPRRP